MYQAINIPIVALDKALEATLNVLVRNVRRALAQASGLPKSRVVGTSVPYGAALCVGGNGTVALCPNPVTVMIGVNTSPGLSAAGKAIGIKSVGYAECLFADGETPVAGQCFYMGTNGEFTMTPGPVEAGIVTNVPANYGTTHIAECLLLAPKCMIPV